MFGPIGAPELIFILVLALLIFGPRRMPEVGRTIGKAVGELRRATTELKRSVNTEIALEDDEDRPRYNRTPRARRSLENPDEPAEEAGGPRQSAEDEFVVTSQGVMPPSQALKAGRRQRGESAAGDAEADTPTGSAAPGAVARGDGGETSEGGETGGDAATADGEETAAPSDDDRTGEP